VCDFGDKDRRTIDPLPIVELIENNGPVSPAQKQELVLQCTLWNEECTKPQDRVQIPGATAGLGSPGKLPVQPEGNYVSIMMGSTFAKAVLLEDENGKHGFFYVFPGLSVRVTGHYRLRFILLRPVPSSGPSAGLPGTYQVIAEVITDTFAVKTAKEFPGRLATTELTKAIVKQGIKI
jgi:hypothetical protein